MITLKVLRVAKGLTQKQLAAAINRDPAVICQVEKQPDPSNRFLTPETVDRLENFFGIPITRLLEPVDYHRILKAC